MPLIDASVGLLERIRTAARDHRRMGYNFPLNHYVTQEDFDALNSSRPNPQWVRNGDNIVVFTAAGNVRVSVSAAAAMTREAFEGAFIRTPPDSYEMRSAMYGIRSPMISLWAMPVDTAPVDPPDPNQMAMTAALAKHDEISRRVGNR